MTVRHRTQGNIAVNTSVAKVIYHPAEWRNIRPLRRIDVHGQYICFFFPIVNILSNLNGKRNIPTFVFSGKLPVYKDLCIAHHSVKVDKKAHILQLRGYGKLLSIAGMELIYFFIKIMIR